MDDPRKQPSDSGTPFEKFKSLLGKLVKVPKKELDKKEAAYQRKRAKKRADDGK